MAQNQTAKLLAPEYFKAKQTNLTAAGITSVSSMYAFSTFTAPYVPIAGTSLTNGVKWDDSIFVAPVGFNFTLYNQTNNSVRLLGGSFFTTGALGNDSIYPIMAPMFENICDKAFDANVDTEGAPGGQSPILYSTTGTPGNRIFKIQVTNAGFHAENKGGGPSTSSVNFQLWLYETSNIIEFRYGAVSIQNATLNLANGNNGFISGLADSLLVTQSTAPQANMLNGNSSNPSVVPWSTAGTAAVTPTITNGRVYRFTRLTAPTGLAKATLSSAIRVFPNPITNVLNIHVSDNFKTDLEITIFNSLGQNVYKGFVSDSETALNLRDLAKGVYFLSVHDGKTGVYNTKFIKE